MAQPYMSSRSPPPLQHPKPTHPAYPPPEPPKTPGGSTSSSPYSQAQRISSDGGYVRYSSPPVDAASNSNSGYGTASTSGFNAYAPQGSEQHGRAGYHAPTPGQTGPVPVQGYSSGFGGPGAPGWQMNDATAQMGVQFGKSAVAAGQDYVEKNVCLYFMG
jgi:hypothetical protein